MEIVQIISQCITAIATIIAVILGIIGITTWKKQLKGEGIYETSIKVLKSIRKLFGEISHFRMLCCISEITKESLLYGLEKIYNQEVKFKEELDNLKILIDTDIDIIDTEYISSKIKMLHYSAVEIMNLDIELLKTNLDEQKRDDMIIRKKDHEDIVKVWGHDDPFYQDLEIYYRDFKKRITQLI